MKVYTFVRKLSLTHVGKSGTHDYYIYFPKGDDGIIESFFVKNQAEQFRVTDKNTGKVYNMKVTFPRGGQECRVVGEFAIFVRDHDLNAGDEVVFEKQVNNKGDVTFYISCRKYNNIVIFEYKKNLRGYVAYNIDRLHKVIPTLPKQINILFRNLNYPVTIRHLGDYKLRSDASDETSIYELDGVEKLPISPSEYIFEFVDNEKVILGKTFDWKFYKTIGE